MQQSQIGEICDKLSTLIVDGKDALRDIYSIGLKTLIADVPDEIGPLVSERLTSRLLNGITRAGSEDVKRECLDNMADLLRRFGHLAPREHEAIMNAVVRQLDHEKPVIRKRAAVCLGSLAVVSSDALLNRLVEIILEQIDCAEKKKGNASVDTRTLIQTIGTISRTVGYRLGRHLERLVPLFLRFCGEPDDESLQNDAANELREHCFPGIESFVLRCPREVSPCLDSILNVSIAFMKYDPNYQYDSDSGERDMDDDGGDADDDGFEDEEYGGSDDDDTSWKVRKSALKVISAIILSRPEMLEDLYAKCADELISRFKEREDNVRLDVIACFNGLLQMTLTTSVSSRPNSSGTRGAATTFSSSSSSSSASSVTSKARAGEKQSSALPFLRQRVPTLVKAATKQLQGQSIKTKSSIFHMLRTLIMVLQGGLEDHLPTLLSCVEGCFSEKSQALKLDALLFLRLAFEMHNPRILQGSINRLLPLVISAVNEEWYKIIAEALRVIGAIISVSRPRDPESDMFVGDFEGCSTMVKPIYAALLPRLEALDIDQEIKECAIISIGKLFAHLGSEIPDQLPTVLTLLRRRLENEVTRISTLKTLSAIASSPLELDISPILVESTQDLAAFLRQQSRLLKQTTLQTLEALVKSKSARITDDQIGAVLRESSVLVSDSDLHLTHLALRVALALFEKFPTGATTTQLRAYIYPRVIELASSPLLQGAAQQTVVSFFQDIVATNSTSGVGVAYDELLDALYTRSTVGADMPKQSISNLAKCMAGICINAPNAAIRDKTLQRFAADLRAPEERKKQLALMCIGEVGQHADLAAAAPSTNLKDLILGCFESGSEETKSAAAFALGHLAVGNMESFLPVVLQAVESNRQQYLLLAALKEIIVIHANSGMDFTMYLEAVLPGLLKHCAADEEGVRNMVAECLGTLTSTHAESIIPVLHEMLQTNSTNLVRWTIASSLRFSLSRHATPTSIAPLTSAMVHFLPMLADADLEVRKAALLMINAAVHHNPSIIEPFVSAQVLPLVYDALSLVLKRSVDLGPFKHTVDDGLPLRKVALACVETMLDTIPDKVDIGAFIPRLVVLLADKDELQLQSHQILSNLCTYAPGAILGSVDQLIEPIAKAIEKKPSEKAVGPELERHLELNRSALRSVLAMSKMECINENRRYMELMEKSIKGKPNILEMWELVAGEKSEY